MKKVLIIFFIGTILSCSSEIKLKSSGISVDYTDSGFEMTSALIPGITLYGNESGGYLYVTKVRLFSNWAQGWTEGFYDASGKYKIEKAQNGFYLIQEDQFELWDIISGEVRYKNKYYRDDDGLQKVRNRVNRINEYVSVIKKAGFGHIDFIGGVNKSSVISNYTLKKDFYPVLFPEVMGFGKLDKANKLPQKYYSANYEITKVDGDNIYWRHDYTKAVYPEQLWELRDSGTIYRDLEESPYIFISLYNLEKFLDRIEEIKCH